MESSTVLVCGWYIFAFKAGSKSLVDRVVVTTVCDCSYIYSVERVMQLPMSIGFLAINVISKCSISKDVVFLKKLI